MGPLEALVAYAEREKLVPGIEYVTSTPERPLVEVHIKQDGRLDKLKVLEAGEQLLVPVDGQRSGQKAPAHLFRDKYKYTFGSLRERQASKCADLLQQYPKCRALRAWYNFLTSNHVTDEETKGLYVPFYRKKSVFETVLEEAGGRLQHEFTPPPDAPKQHDVITGKLVVPTALMPPRVTALGTTIDGGTFLSTNSVVHNMLWTTDRHQHLGIARGEYTNTMHVQGMRRLVDTQQFVAVGRKGTENSLWAFLWLDEPNGVERDLLRSFIRPTFANGQYEGLKLEELEALDVPDCEARFLLVKEHKRLQLYGYHALPARELHANLVQHGRRFAAHDGSLLTIQHMLRSLWQYKSPTLRSNKSYFEATSKWVNSETYRPLVASIIDAAVSGAPYPYMLHQLVRSAYLKEDLGDVYSMDPEVYRKPAIKEAKRHKRLQERVLKGMSEDA